MSDPVLYDSEAYDTLGMRLNELIALDYYCYQQYGVGILEAALQSELVGHQGLLGAFDPERLGDPPADVSPDGTE